MGNIYQYGIDIKNDVLQRGGEATSSSSYDDRVKSYVWRAYLKVLRIKPWLSALKHPPGIINTVAEENTGTAACTEGSTTVTLSTVIATSMADRKFKIDDEGVYYRISAHTAGTAAVTLDATYKEDTVTAGAFTIFQDEYNLASDVLVPWRFWIRGDFDHIIIPENAGVMSRDYSDRSIYTSTGCISRIAMLTDTKVRIYPWTQNAETLEYDYTPMPDELDYGGSTTDTPIIGLYERPLMADIALSFLLFDKDDNRFIVLEAKIEKLINELSDMHHAKTPGRMVPRQSIASRRRR